MKIKSIHIERFGPIANRTIFLDKPFTVVFGPNEAGKSTLMAFVRAILFGFPARSGADTAGWRSAMPSAGYLTVVGRNGGELRIERRETLSGGSGRGRAQAGGQAALIREDGSVESGDSALAALLGGISGELYSSLFAFGLSELQELRTLTSDELSGYLYSAGLGSRGASIMAAERKLGQDMEQLYRPRGKNQELHRTLKTIEQLEADVRRGFEQSGRYNALIAELDWLEAAASEADTSANGLRAELGWLELCEQARDVWQRLQTVERELHTLPAADVSDEAPFPEQAMSRYEQLTGELDRLLDEEGRLLLKLGKQEEAMAPLIARQAGDSRLAGKADMMPLVEKIGAYRSGIVSLAEQRLELEQLEEQLAKLQRQIDESWTEEELDRQLVTVAKRDQARDFAERFKQATRSKERADEEWIRRTEEAAAASDELVWRDEALAEAVRKRDRMLDMFGILPSPQAKGSDRLGVTERGIAARSADYEAHADAALAQLRRDLLKLQELQLELRHAAQRERDFALRAEPAPVGRSAAGDAGGAALARLAW
ncbi:AAA family ATPase, partial [Paenibacillus contaminans]